MIFAQIKRYLREAQARAKDVVSNALMKALETSRSFAAET